MRLGEIKTDIIENGLVFNMDAANRASYPRTGTTATDTVSSLTGTINGASFETTNSGVFSLDGINDYINFGNIQNPGTNSQTSCVWFYIDSLPFSNFYGILTKNGYTNSNIPTLFLLTKQSSNRVYVGNQFDTPSNIWEIEVNLGWNCLSIVRDIEQSKFSVYLNGNLSTNAITSTPSEVTLTAIGNAINSDPLVLGSQYNGSIFWRNYYGQISNVKIYNRALSANEVLHNFNALRGRFGV